MTANQYYYDAGWLIERSPYMRLISEKKSKDFLNDLYDTVCEYAYLLKEYPEKKYEQVDQLYYIHQNLSLLDVNLASDFFQHSFRGACWASLLIAINPHEKYLGLVNSFLEECHPKNRWIASLALCSITKGPHEYQDKIASIREKCKLLKKETFSIRLSPSQEEQTRHHEEVVQLRQFYRAHGLEPTLRLLKTKSVYQYSLNLNEWLSANKRKTHHESS